MLSENFTQSKKLAGSKFSLGFLLLIYVFSGWTCAAQPSSTLPEVGSQSAEELEAAQNFGALVRRLSGAGGYFDTDNLISNESSYLHVVPRLKALELKGGAYLGVGPDQNYSYIAHLKPEIAIILDIRRDNLLTHLLYKALFELSDDRKAFLENLFARRVENRISDLEQFLDALQEAPVLDDPELSALIKIVGKKIEQSGVELTDEDKLKIIQIHGEFIEKGPLLRFTSHGRAPQSYYPTYRQLALETTVAGDRVGYLSDEELFHVVKKMHEEDRIVPAVGNFAGPHALVEIGRYLEEINLEVTAFYTSNVEYYLVNQGAITRFANNVNQLPVQGGGVFIRSYFNRWRSGHPQSVPGYGSTQILQYIKHMKASSDLTYRDLILENILDY